MSYPSQAEKEANPHYTVIVYVKFTKGESQSRVTRDTASVVTTDDDPESAIRHAIDLLEVELTRYGRAITMAAPKPRPAGWPATDKKEVR